MKVIALRIPIAIAIAIAIAATVSIGCTTLPDSLEIEASPNSSAVCRFGVRNIPSRDPLATLDRFSDLIESDCIPEAITLGRWIRENYREKTYSVVRESASILVPEDALSEYVLESYERAYLSYVLAALEVTRGRPDSARVELRRSYREGKSILYNYGEDGVNVVLIAALWETLGEPNDARPFWKKASELPGTPETVRVFAKKQIERLDKNEFKQWQIQRIGSMPPLDWQTRFGGDRGAGYYEINAKEKLPFDCSSKTGLVVSVQPWIDKIALRHSKGYHPYLNAKTWVRLPIGLIYGATAVVGGVAIAAGGCYADSEGGGNGNMCGESLALGAQLAGEAGNITSYMIRPDLRHWRKVPAGFVVSTADDLRNEKCYAAALAPNG